MSALTVTTDKTEAAVLQQVNLWNQLLDLARAEDGDEKGSLHGILCGFRIYGARLEPHKDGGVIIIRGPIPDDPQHRNSTEAEWSETWDEWRRLCLLPKREKVTRILEKVTV